VVPYPAEIVEQLPDEQYVRNMVDVLFQHNLPASPGTMARKFPGSDG